MESSLNPKGNAAGCRQAPNQYRIVAVRRADRDCPLVSIHMVADQTRYINGHLLSELTETNIRVVKDTVDGKLAAIEYAVIRRYCRRQVSQTIPGVIPKERFGVNPMSLEPVMRMYGITYGII